MKIVSGKAKPRKPISDNLTTPDIYAINGITYLQAIEMLNIIKQRHVEEAIQYGNDVIVPDEKWSLLSVISVEDVVDKIYHEHWRHFG